MSGNRFHNKFHRNAHHTLATDGDIDSGTDPMASSANPFLGDFSLSGDMILVDSDSKVQAPSGEFGNVRVDTISSSGGIAINSNITMGGDINMSGKDLIGVAIDDLDDVTITTPVSENILTYNGGVWKNLPISLPTATDSIEGIVEYATDAEASAGILEDRVVNPKQLKASIPVNITDMEYAPISSTTGGDPTPLNTRSTVGATEFVYNIANLQGTGLNTINIRTLYVRFESNNSQVGTGPGQKTISKGYATMPNDLINYELMFKGGMSGNEDAGCEDGAVVSIPINLGQVTVKIKIEILNSVGYGASITSKIIGATQLV